MARSSTGEWSRPLGLWNTEPSVTSQMRQLSSVRWNFNWNTGRIFHHRSAGLGLLTASYLVEWRHKFAILHTLGIPAALTRRLIAGNLLFKVGTREGLKSGSETGRMGGGAHEGLKSCSETRYQGGGFSGAS